jgi:uncharacterized protein (TIGR02145 family)
MKKLFTIVVAVLLTATVWAQSPEKMSYQAVIRDASDNLVTSQTVGMQISILQGSASGTAVYVETQTPTSNANGLVSIEIGGGVGFDTINWANGPYFIKTETDPAGGTSYSITGTSQLLSVPYALHAKTAEGVSKDYTENIMGIIQTLQNGVRDYDGNNYKTILIGNQVWMAENLKVTHYADGTPIPHVTGDVNWDTLDYSDKAYCYYDDDSATNAETYGALYTWAAAMNGAASSNSNPSGVQGVCPTGWHLPSDDEWTALENYLIANGYNWDGSTSGDKTGKSLAASSGWSSSSTTGDVGNDQQSNNSTGFRALPGGYRYGDGTFDGIGSHGYWWSATENYATSAWSRTMYYSTSNVYSGNNGKVVGISVRCVRD